MKYKLTLFFAGLLSINSLIAQDSKTLTLKEAIDLSLKNSKLLKLNEAKIQEAIAISKEAEERRLPDASISGSYLYLPLKPNINMKNDTSTGGSGGPNVSQVIYGSATVSVPIYTGGKLKYGIESARYLEQALKADATSDRTTIVINTINACVNLFKANEAIVLVKEDLEQSRQRVNDLSNLEKNGLLARNDLLKAQLQSSNFELSLLDAESNYKLACVNMNLMIGLPEETVLTPDKNGLTLPDSVKTISEYEQEALQNRNDIVSATLRKKAAESGVKSIRADYYPNIAFTGGYIAVDIPKFLSITNAVNVGVGVKYSISSLWKTNTKIKEAEAKVQQIQLSKDMLNDNIRLQINQTYQYYLVSRKKIQVYENAVIQATENYRITQNKFNNSLATTTEVLDADVALLQARLSVTNAKAESFLAYNKLLYAAGLLKN